MKSKVIETGHLATAGISNWIGGRELLVETVAQNIQSDPAPEAVRKTIDKQVFADSFLFTYFGSNQGVMIMSPDEPLPADYDPRKRPWYTSTSETKTSLLTEPYEDASTGNLIVTSYNFV